MWRTWLGGGIYILPNHERVTSWKIFSFFFFLFLFSETKLTTHRYQIVCSNLSCPIFFSPLHQPVGSSIRRRDSKQMKGHVQTGVYFLLPLIAVTTVVVSGTHAFEWVEREIYQDPIELMIHPGLKIYRLGVFLGFP